MLRTSLLPNVNAVRYQIRLLSPTVDTVFRASGAVRRYLNQSDGELVEYGASLGFATI